MYTKYMGRFNYVFTHIKRVSQDVNVNLRLISIH